MLLLGHYCKPSENAESLITKKFDGKKYLELETLLIYSKKVEFYSNEK